MVLYAYGQYHDAAGEHTDEQGLAENYFDNELAGELLTNYITVKSPIAFFYELMDSEYKRLMNDVVKAKGMQRVLNR